MRTGILSGKTALVVGGTGGIGKAISHRLADAGTQLFVHGSEEGAKTGKDTGRCGVSPQVGVPPQRSAAQGAGSPPLYNEIRFSITPDVDALMSSELFKRAGDCDILCVCFGPFLQAPLHRMEAHDWERIVFCNYTLPGILVSACLPAMCGRKWGRILLFGGTGTGAIAGFRTNAAYAGAKTAVSSLVKSVACEYASSGITCNALLPGFTDTEYLSDAERRALEAKIPGGVLIHPEEIAETALYVLKCPSINGALISIDKGWKA